MKQRHSGIGIAAVTLALAAAHCTISDGGDDGGLTVDISLASRAAASRWTTDLGYELAITRGEVALAPVAILECGSEATAPAPLRRWGGLRSAYAHSRSEPRKLGVPAIVSFAPVAGAELELGTLKPPPGRYCAARIALGPADDDAEGMPEDAAMRGVTVLVEGTWLAPGSNEPVPFRVVSPGSREVDWTLDLALAKNAREHATLRVVVDASAPFDGIDFAALDEAAVADAVLVGVASALRAEVE